MTTGTRDIEIAVHHLEIARGIKGALLPPDAEFPHRVDGVAAGSGLRCQAFSAAGQKRCPKAAAISLLTSSDETFVIPMAGYAVMLCGTHFDQHRRRKSMVIYAGDEA